MSSFYRKVAIEGPLKVVLPYVVFSAFYIYASDYILSLFVSDVDQLSRYQTIKGIGFIIATGLLLYFLSRKHFLNVKRYYEALIMEKERSSKRVQLSEEKYWTLFNISPLPMWIYDWETCRFLQVNESAIKKYGYSADEFSKMPLRDIRLEEDIPLLHDALRRVKGKKSWLWPDVFRHKTRDGVLLYVKIESVEITFEGLTARLVSVTDVSDEMRSKNQLEQVNKMLKSASEIAKLGYWINNLGTGSIYWADETFKIYELDKTGFVPTMDGVRERFHPDDRHFLDDNLADTFGREGVSDFEHRIITGAGQEKWVKERVIMLRDENGRPARLEGVVLDITERKKSEQALQETNERLRMVMKATVEAIIDWDIEQDTIYLGDGFRHLFGHTFSAHDQTIWSRYIHPADRDAVQEEMRLAMADKRKDAFYAEFRFLKGNGEAAYVQHRSIFVRNEQGKVIRAVGAMIDVSESMARLRKIEEQNRLLRDIAWTQSHVIRSPLANLMGLADLLCSSKALEEEERKLVEAMQTSAIRLDDAIRDVVKRSEVAGTTV